MKRATEAWMFRLGRQPRRPIDQLRPGLLRMVLDRLRALNANTQVLLRLLEEQDWSDLRTRALNALRNRTPQ